MCYVIQKLMEYFIFTYNNVFLITKSSLILIGIFLNITACFPTVLSYSKDLTYSLTTFF